MTRIDLVLVPVSTSHVVGGSNQRQTNTAPKRRAGWEGKKRLQSAIRCGSDEYLSQDGKPTRRGCHLLSVCETCGALKAP